MNVFNIVFNFCTESLIALAVWVKHSGHGGQPHLRHQVLHQGNVFAPAKSLLNRVPSVDSQCQSQCQLDIDNV